MTDFVDRLLGRTAGAPIRPLLPTLYEPLTRGDVDDALPMGVFTDAPGTEHATDSGAAASRSAPEPTRALAAAPESPAPSPIAHKTVVEAPRRTEQPPAASRQTAPTTSTPAAIPQGRVAAEPVERRISLERPDSPGPQPSGLPPAAPPPAHRAVPAGPAPAPTAINERPAQGPNVFQQRFVSTRDRIREPDVQISIGRVEIKASAPTAQAPRRADAPRRPQLTLDDYLKSRGS
jgi:hypothetical protein